MSFDAVKKRLVYTAPQGLADRIREFARENEFANEREAISALIEGALDQYPRWGVKKGVMRVVRAEVTGLLGNQIREKLSELARDFDAQLEAPPPAEDMDL